MDLTVRVSAGMMSAPSSPREHRLRATGPVLQRLERTRDDWRCRERLHFSHLYIDFKLPMYGSHCSAFKLNDWFQSCYPRAQRCTCELPDKIIENHSVPKDQHCVDCVGMTTCLWVFPCTIAQRHAKGNIYVIGQDIALSAEW